MSSVRAVMGKENPKEHGLFLLGVTGGVASGKSTVAGMLEELGAPVIDFDWLSRVVVEPGRPAWEEIVSFFGKEVLLPDRTLDRKKLSQIVFRDPEKRRKLEEITHPRIFSEFSLRVEELAQRDPGAIVQAVIPLLIESNLQPLFSKLLLVYAPREVQVLRLMERDRISRERAEEILAAQLPIEEKRAHADFIVDNSGTREETRKQVEEIWRKLKGPEGPRNEPGPPVEQRAGDRRGILPSSRREDSSGQARGPGKGWGEGR